MQSISPSLSLSLTRDPSTNRHFDRALKLLQRATAPPPKPSSKKSIYDEEPVQAKVHKSIRIWTLFADLEESLGTLASTKAVYDRMIELKVATPQIILNYATFLEEHKFFEEAFKAFEKGINLFTYPSVYPIWSTYLTKFIGRYVSMDSDRSQFKPKKYKIIQYNKI